MMRCAVPAGMDSPTPKRRTTPCAILGVLLVALVMAPGSRAAATAPSDDAVISLKRRTSKDCSVERYHTVFRGSFPGADVPITIATFSVEACGGGSNGGGSFGVFSEQGGSVVEWPQTPVPAGRVSGVELAGSKLLVQWMAFRPKDSMCCPSEAHRAPYRLDRRKVVLDR